MRTAVTSLALVLATAAAPGAAAAAPREATPRVAVVIDLVASVTPERATELGEALANALQKELQVDAIGGGDVSRRLPAGGVPEGCVAEPPCIADLGTRLDASQLLFLSIVQVGDVVRIDSTWVAVATGHAVSRPRVELPADTSASQVFAEAAPRLLPDVPRRPEDTGKAPAGPSRHMTTGSWVAGGVALAALGAGIGLGLSANGTYDRCERSPDTCDADTRDGISTRAMLADVAFGAALIGATTATILYLRSADRREVAPSAQTWLVTPTRAGAMAEVRVRF